MITHHVTKQKESQTGFMNMKMSSMFLSGLPKFYRNLTPVEQLWDAVERDRNVQLTDLQNRTTQSCQHETESQRNAFNVLKEERPL